MIMNEFYSRILERLNFFADLNSQIQISFEKEIIILAGKVSSYFEKKLIEKALTHISEGKVFCNKIDVDDNRQFRLSDDNVALLEITAITA